MNEPRNWKWLAPAGAMAVLFAAGLILQAAVAELPVLMQFGCLAAVVMVMIFAAIAAWANFHNYFAWEEIERFERTQQALIQTPATLIAESLRGMHPEAVKVLNRFGVRTRWGVRAEAERDWVLMDANVPMSFVEHVLDHSNETTLMAKRMLVEGAKHWDPDGIDQDYALYDRLQAWMIGRLMVTRPWGNLASQWIPPWDPETVKEVMGLSTDSVTESQTETDKNAEAA